MHPISDEWQLYPRGHSVSQRIEWAVCGELVSPWDGRERVLGGRLGGFVEEPFHILFAADKHTGGHAPRQRMKPHNFCTNVLHNRSHAHETISAFWVRMKGSGRTNCPSPSFSHSASSGSPSIGTNVLMGIDSQWTQRPDQRREEELLSRKRGKRDRKGVGSISKMWATLRIFREEKEGISCGLPLYRWCPSCPCRTARRRSCSTSRPPPS